jgi:D-threo-aldose 1-dehydrogenase
VQHFFFVALPLVQFSHHARLRLPAPYSPDTIKAALELGFLDLDTAPHYGLGLSEARLGRAVAAHGGGRAVRLWSKVGRVMKPHAEVTAEDEPRAERGNMPGAAGCIFPDSPTDVTPVLDYTGPGVRRSHADSLRRLGAATVHGLRVHDAEDEERFAQAMAPGGGIDALVELRSQGAITCVSLGMNDPKYVMRMITVGPWNIPA